MSKRILAALDRLDASLGKMGNTLHHATEGDMSNWRRNVLSLQSIPDGLIDEDWRAELIGRADAGEEVYAYTAHHTEGIEPRWFVWDDKAEQPASPMYHGVRYPLDELEGGRPANG